MTDEPTEGFAMTQEDFIHRQTWAIALRAYLAIAEMCSPPGAFKQVQEATGLHYAQQNVIRTLLAANGIVTINKKGIMEWAVPKAERRRLLATIRYPKDPPPKTPLPYPATPSESSESTEIQP